MENILPRREARENAFLLAFSQTFGDLPLEEALNEFERGVQLARQGQAKLQQAEQRVQILLSDNEDASLTPFTPDNE